MRFIQPNTLVQNRYHVSGFIAQGAIGAIYRAFDNRLKSEVAIKQQLLDLGDFYVTLFNREAELLANLKHPGLPRVTDYFSENSEYFPVMELIEGDDLQSIIKKGSRLSSEESLHCFEQLLDNLIYLHSTNVVHSVYCTHSCLGPGTVLVLRGLNGREVVCPNLK